MLPALQSIDSLVVRCPNWVGDIVMATPVFECLRRNFPQATISALVRPYARGILEGPDDAASRYFREHSEAALREQFLPIVKETTASAGVTSAYKNMTGKLGGLGGMFNTQSLDVDEYVTDRALDGLFTIVAQEEARIREDPVARSTDLLKKVFGGG